MYVYVGVGRREGGREGGRGDVVGFGFWGLNFIPPHKGSRGVSGGARVVG